MPTVELDCGLIDYVDTGGDGPVVVFTHGFPMSASQWRKVVPLMAGHRCVLPTLPMGSHRHPMERGTDLSQLGMARIVAQLLDRLDLRDVTLVMNDWGGPQFLVADDRHERIARMVFVACEAFDNFPPRAARPFAAGLRLPGGPWLAAQLFRTPMVRRGRNAYGAMSLSPIRRRSSTSGSPRCCATDASAPTSRPSARALPGARCWRAGTGRWPSSTSPRSWCGRARTR